MARICSGFVRDLLGSVGGSVKCALIGQCLLALIQTRPLRFTCHSFRHVEKNVAAFTGKSTHYIGVLSDRFPYGLDKAHVRAGETKRSVKIQLSSL